MSSSEESSATSGCEGGGCTTAWNSPDEGLVGVGVVGDSGSGGSASKNSSGWVVSGGLGGRRLRPRRVSRWVGVDGGFLAYDSVGKCLVDDVRVSHSSCGKVFGGEKKISGVGKFSRDVDVKKKVEAGVMSATLNSDGETGHGSEASCS